MSEHAQPIVIDPGDAEVSVIAFTPDSEYLVGGGEGGLRAWRVKDGEQIATMPMTHGASCIALSKDGRWIAAGSFIGMFIWDATTCEQVFHHREQVAWVISDVDFSPDSSRLVSNSGAYRTTVWDVAGLQKVQTLDHQGYRWTGAAKYSPQGDKIATASEKCVRIWDSNDGSLLVDVGMGASTLLWSNHHNLSLFAATDDSKIKQIDAVTGSVVAEWSVPHTNHWAHLALLPHGKFIACTKGDVTIWNTSKYTQIGLISLGHRIHSTAFSPDDRLVAVAAGKEKLIIEDLSLIQVHLSLQEPEILIDSAALDAWKQGQLADAEALLTATITTSGSTAHHALASRALIRVRLGQCNAALSDAEESIKTQPSVIGYVAMCVALIRKGDAHGGYQACDIVSQHFNPDYVNILSLIKAVALFMAGEHVDAISRINDLITDVFPEPTFIVVQAYMHLLLGDLHIKSGPDYEHAIQSFQYARIKLGNYTRPPPLIVSLISGWEFDDLAITIEQCLCEALLAADRTKEAAESVLRLELQESVMTQPLMAWVSDFKSRCRSKSEDLGDTAVEARDHDEAILQYTAALLLDSSSQRKLLVGRSKALARKGLWKDALDDANEVIKLDPSSLLGHERKYHALLGAGDDSGAADVFQTMLSKMAESSDPDIRKRSHHYVRPEETKKMIRTSVENITRDSPLVLINAMSGRLCNKSEHKAAFESMPIFAELVSTMTISIDHTRIEREVEEFYRYATFSHTWQGNEPEFAAVSKVNVYHLEALSTHEKLRRFCEIVRDMGFNWAWSDTCCIDQKSSSVLQEAIGSMFKWYEGSAMTIIFLFDVDDSAGPEAMVWSRWNSRGWTLQEYHASKVVRFYTKNWTPYLGLDIYNHKDSPQIMLEMEKATGISAEALKALRPGLDNIRQKLHLASTRQTTKVEDAAYSLFGIFSVSLPVQYGDGDRALGQLLSQLLTSSGDTSILAWSGKSGSFNSCLPGSITVFKELSALHIPPVIPNAEMGTIIAQLHASSLDLILVAKLYDRLNVLPVPFFVGQRMKLPCLVFKIKLTSISRNGSDHVFHAQAAQLGLVEIKTKQNLARLGSLYLVHPWIDFLLDRHPVSNVTEMPEDDASSASDELSPVLDDLSDPGVDAASLSPSSPVLSADKEMHILQFTARLRRPFGPLLLTPTRQNVEEYKRVATESLIMVQVEELTSTMLDGLVQGVRVLDVL